MEDLHLTSLGLLLILVGIFVEGCSFLLYKRAKYRLKRLSGTGRMNDIEIAHNWQLFFRGAMLAVPVVLYLLKSAILPS
jgi:hypothetical protein